MQGSPNRKTSLLAFRFLVPASLHCSAMRGPGWASERAGAAIVKQVSRRVYPPCVWRENLERIHRQGKLLLGSKETVEQSKCVRIDLDHHRVRNLRHRLSPKAQPWDNGNKAQERRQACHSTWPFENLRVLSGSTCSPPRVKSRGKVEGLMALSQIEGIVSLSGPC